MLVNKFIRRCYLIFFRKRADLLTVIDVILIGVSYFASYLIRFDFQLAPIYYESIILTTIIFEITIVSCLYFSGNYKIIWRYATTNELIRLLLVVLIGSSLASFIIYIVNLRIPRSIYLLSYVLITISLLVSRIIYMYINEKRKKFQSYKIERQKRALIIGAGSAGQLILNELKKHSEVGILPVAFLDDDENKHYRYINGVIVLGKIEELPYVVEEKSIDLVIYAIPSAHPSLLRKVLNLCNKAKVELRTIPGVYELIRNPSALNVRNIRKVNLEDLLRREPIKIDLKDISEFLVNKRVLVTGAGGSIGSEIVRQVLRFEPAEVICLDIYENTLYDLQQELINTPYISKCKFLIGSIRDINRLENIFKQYKPEIVFHAAAHKHVPLMEDSPQEAVKNNIFGTLNLVEISDKYNIKKFIMISTDKAVNPKSVMGMTKRICELLVQAYNSKSDTEFSIVRFGNVLGSNGSVVPLFMKQIEKGGPVTVTHEEVRRYFMTINEAVQLVLQAAAFAKGGEVFVLDMGEPVKIIDLARDLIRIYGYEPDVDIKIEIIGLRPGEKLYEELLIDKENCIATKNDKIWVEKTYNSANVEYILEALDFLRSNIDEKDNEGIKEELKLVLKNIEKAETTSVSPVIDR
ncbi:polysaccharide biosynthesis protein CapD [Caldicellulosiruptor acetigenus I77R1B]|uniref:Polysaccharide biosynthesis protein CapD n=1 Tax=Caldicellulosiruptor acetigenus (strain ATCC 700853 / DSM 12137 / I77R1B) TaxID=632335 RepID=E4S6V7_CALA7|nr:nucleoside-diphosphate sugar epimerase/dehydratase [Caldicellulosiruptor acetigenus]ADQ41740.1 polysaccharide biosynthesis protein CapD [Caldicellulosiruptor acetigenus I77R1B]